MEWTKNAPICSCCEGTDIVERVLFICLSPACPAFHKQRVFCQRCLETSDHIRPYTKIVDQLGTMAKEWDITKESVDALHNKATKQQEKRGELISDLEGLYAERQVAGYRHVSADFAKLCQVQEETTASTERLEKAIQDKDAVVALNVILSVTKVSKTLDELMYLGDLSDDFIYKNFATIWREHSFISGASRLPVEDRLTIVDMRVRSMNA